MSVAGLSNAERACKKWAHERSDSGELDVFEAARYFSGAGENLAGYNNQKKMMREDRQDWRSGGRMSLDVPMRSSTIPSSTQTHHHHHHHHGIEKEKKYKQPNSPGGRLASFLNSLFKQTSSKKKKSKSGSTQSIKDEDDSPGWRRRRRSSISHFHTHSNTNSNSNSNSDSIFSSSSSITSGFRTPPPYPYSHADTPTKSTYKDFRCYSDHHGKQLPLSSSFCSNNVNATRVKSSTAATTTTTLQNGADKRSIADYAWLDDKLKFGSVLTQKLRMSTDKYPSADKELIRHHASEVDEGADSDSSSDLFELQNYDLGYYSSGLPVYETARLDTIKRAPPFCNAPV